MTTHLRAWAVTAAYFALTTPLAVWLGEVSTTSY